MMQFDDHVSMRLISQLTKVISRIFQKFFYGTVISTAFVLPSSGVFPVTFTLDLNDSESIKVLFGSSL